MNSGFESAGCFAFAKIFQEALFSIAPLIFIKQRAHILSCVTGIVGTHADHDGVN